MADTVLRIRTPRAFAFNPATKANDIVSGDEIAYEGPGRVRPRDTQDAEEEAGESPVSTWAYMVSVPFGATRQGAAFLPAVDMVVEVVSNPDGTLAGQRLRVRQVIQGDHITARRMQCEVYAG